MKHKNLAAAQTVNACTLISLAVINAILSARDEQAMEAEIKRAHNDSQKRYREEFAIAENEEGVLEEDAYRIFYSAIFFKPASHRLVVPVDEKDFDNIIANRNGYLEDNDLNLEFFTFNADLTDAIQKLAPKDTQINWITVTAEELRKIVKVKLDKQLPLIQLYLDQIKALNFQGITLRMDGHTISLVKRGATYYSYDSLTGNLSTTKNPQEMAEHLVEKTTRNGAKEALIYHFSPKHVPNLRSNNATIQKSEVGGPNGLNKETRPLYEKQMNQNCAEVMLIKAAQLVMGKGIQFDYREAIADIQVDISPALMASPDEEKQIWYSGGNKQSLENDLAKLDKSKVYFLRTGANNRAGHWQTLYFDSQQKGWIIYSTETNKYQLTQNSSLTEQGKKLLSLYATWGKRDGESSFLLVDASEQNIINSVSYLYNFRVHGEESALKQLFKKTHNEGQVIHGYGKIKDAPKPPVNRDSQQLIDILIDIIETLRLSILNQYNDRKTNRNSQWKAGLLAEISNNLQDEDSGTVDINQYIAAIRAVCAKKRNSLHFWAEPHSVSEFENLLNENGIPTSQPMDLRQH